MSQSESVVKQAAPSGGGIQQPIFAPSSGTIQSAGEDVDLSEVFSDYFIHEFQDPVNNAAYLKAMNAIAAVQSSANAQQQAAVVAAPAPTTSPAPVPTPPESAPDPKAFSLPVGRGIKTAWHVGATPKISAVAMHHLRVNQLKNEKEMQEENQNQPVKKQKISHLSNGTNANEQHQKTTVVLHPGMRLAAFSAGGTTQTGLPNGANVGTAVQLAGAIPGTQTGSTLSARLGIVAAVAPAQIQAAQSLQLAVGKNSTSVVTSVATENSANKSTTQGTFESPGPGLVNGVSMTTTSTPTAAPVSQVRAGSALTARLGTMSNVLPQPQVPTPVPSNHQNVQSTSAGGTNTVGTPVGIQVTSAPTQTPTGKGITLPVGVGIRLGGITDTIQAAQAQNTNNTKANSLPMVQHTQWNKGHAGISQPLSFLQQSNASKDGEVSEKVVAQRRQRNREHAKRSRVRKKFLLESLQLEVRALQKENMELRMCVQEKIPDKAQDIIKECCKGSPMFYDLNGKNSDGEASAAGSQVSPLVSSDFSLVKSLTASQQNFVLSDPRLPDNPIVFASQGFFDLTGYSKDEVLGRNCRFLQGPGTEQRGIDIIRKAITNGTEVTTCIMNYKADGTPFWNQLYVAPLRDGEDCIVNYVGVQCEVEPDVGASALEAKVNAVLPLQVKNEAENQQ